MAKAQSQVVQRYVFMGGVRHVPSIRNSLLRNRGTPEGKIKLIQSTQVGELYQHEGATFFFGYINGADFQISGTSDSIENTKSYLEKQLSLRLEEIN